MSLKGKTLFITGGSRGIGLAIGLKAASEGANIAIAAKTVEPHPKLEGTIHTAAAEIAKAGGRALPLAVDVRDEAAVQAALDEAANRRSADAEFRGFRHGQSGGVLSQKLNSRALLRAAERKGRAVGEHLELAEESEGEVPRLSCHREARIRPGFEQS